MDQWQRLPEVKCHRVIAAGPGQFVIATETKTFVLEIPIFTKCNYLLLAEKGNLRHIHGKFMYKCRNYERKTKLFRFSS